MVTLIVVTLYWAVSSVSHFPRRSIQLVRSGIDPSGGCLTKPNADKIRIKFHFLNKGNYLHIELWRFSVGINYLTTPLPIRAASVQDLSRSSRPCQSLLWSDCRRVLLDCRPISLIGLIFYCSFPTKKKRERESMYLVKMILIQDWLEPE